MNSIDEFLRICRDEKRLGPKTLRLYEHELKILSQLENAEAIRTHLLPLAPATFIRKVILWKAYAKMLDPALLEILKPIRFPKLKQREPSFLTPSETKRLREKIQTLMVEDQLFFELALSMGLRLSEIMGIKSGDFEDETLRIIRKGDKEQRLLLSMEVLNLKKAIPEPRFYRSHVHYWRLVKKVAKLAGIQKSISPHSLRHTFASTKASDGKSLRTLMIYLGHSNMATTQRYLHDSPEYQREFIRGK